jgi:hypothetical protein
MTEIEQQLLRAIEKHDGEWTWYQLDRVLDPSKNMTLMPSLNGLIAAGHIEEIPGHHPSMPFYKITESGRSAL